MDLSPEPGTSPLISSFTVANKSLATLGMIGPTLAPPIITNAPEALLLGRYSDTTDTNELPFETLFGEWKRGDEALRVAELVIVAVASKIIPTPTLLFMVAAIAYIAWNAHRRRGMNPIKIKGPNSSERSGHDIRLRTSPGQRESVAYFDNGLQLKRTPRTSYKGGGVSAVELTAK